MTNTLNRFAVALLVFSALAFSHSVHADDEETQPIEVAVIEREESVDFEKEILPLLKKSCLACHNKADASSDLVLEDPESILKGGALGAAVVPSKGDESLLLQVATGREEPMMPPEDNDVGAPPFTPQELGLIKLWIDQGAKGEVAGQSAPLAWQPLPAGINPIYSVAVSPDGQYAACGRANQIFVYHIQSGQLVDRLTDPNLMAAGLYKNAGVAHLDIVQSLAFSPDGRTLASGGYRVVKLWQRPENPVSAAPLELGYTPRLTAMSTDGKRLVTADVQGHVRLLTLGESPQTIELVGTGDHPVGVGFVEDGQTIVTASADGSLRLWNAGDGRLKSRIDTPAPISSMAVASHGKHIVAAGGDAKLRALSLPTMGVRQLLAATYFSVATASPDGKWLAMGHMDGTVRVLSLGEGSALKSWKAHEGAITALAFRADSGELMTASEDHQLKLWAPGEWGMTSSVELPDRIPAAACSLAGSRRFAVGDTRGQIVLWNPDVMEPPAVLVEGVASADAAAEITSLVASNDAATIVAATNATLRALSAEGGEVRYTIKSAGGVNAIAMSPDGAVLASVGQDQQVRLWNTADGQPAAQATLSGFQAPATSVAFVTPQQLVAGSADGQVLVFNTATGVATQAFSQHQGPVEFVAGMSGEVPAVITGAQGHSFMQWPLLASHVVALPSANVTSVIPVAVEGLQVVAANKEGVAQQWDLIAGNLVKEYKHGATITAAAISADGTHLATAGEDKSVRLWNTADGAALGEIRGDQKANREQARFTSLVAVAKTKDDAAKEKATTSVKTVEERVAAVAKAKTELEAAIAAAESAQQGDANSKAAKVAAEKLAADTGAAAKKAAEAKTAADGVVTLAMKHAAEATETATAAVAAHDQLTAALQSATTAVEKAKASAGAAPDDQQLATILDSATKTFEGVKALIVPAEASRQAAEKLAAERKAAAEEAVKNQKAAEVQVTETAAAAKKAEEELAAATKAAEETQKTLTDATNKKTAAERAASDADAAQARAERARESANEKSAETGAFLASQTELLTKANEQAAAGETIIRTLVFSTDGLQLAVAGDNGLVQTYRADNGNPTGAFTGHTGSVHGLRYLDPSRLVSISEDKKIQTWNLTSPWTLSGQIGPPLDAPTTLDTSPLADRVLALDFSPDGSLLVTGGGEPSRTGELKLWNVADGSLRHDFVDAHSDTVFGVAFSADSRYLATSSADKFVKVFDVQSRDAIRSYEGHTHHVLGVAWQWDGTVLASCGADNVVKIWNFESGEQQRTIGGFGKQATSITFAGKLGETLTSAADKSVRLHTVGDGKNIRNFGGGTDYMYSVDVTGDGNLVVGGGADSVLRVWNKADGKAVATFEPPEQPADQISAAK